MSGRGERRRGLEGRDRRERRGQEEDDEEGGGRCVASRSGCGVVALV